MEHVSWSNISVGSSYASYLPLPAGSSASARPQLFRGARLKVTTGKELMRFSVAPHPHRRRSSRSTQLRLRSCACAPGRASAELLESGRAGGNRGAKSRTATSVVRTATRMSSIAACTEGGRAQTASSLNAERSGLLRFVQNAVRTS
jgi:hypothetical protein